MRNILVTAVALLACALIAGCGGGGGDGSGGGNGFEAVVGSYGSIDATGDGADQLELDGELTPDRHIHVGRDRFIGWLYDGDSDTPPLALDFVYMGPDPIGAQVERLALYQNTPGPGGDRWDSNLTGSPVPGITIGDGEVTFDNVTIWSAGGTQIVLNGGPLEYLESVAD